ncbi:DNA invertase Pin-like site-specific DNA recombinase [Sphingobium wenxiniae]|uniref:DNA invertase Pin-like site-specific DNA recombinase n=1 Tax=Sphingobium wenxiniae (strain DSM 21828 / CGMCC 1.7748 / JZ-1) TaxID=595605 RepID=A0A562KN38_SPHWJ|nr:recombinase family protein [Sphingobium wenxiniae]MBB6193184.1 DNA invertase Pin-like site-specific DNA recombinase [Sphingobium wenxiniae]TWH96757.1 DNA invertase Pin-like site-specific DNA recombinase [Sphingobium wenxiniae]
MTDTAPRRRLRCAVYTRKSSEEGLDMEFNSLDAQRESCEAYIASQRAEGWACMRERYDDGGYSGGSLERPGLKALLEDVEAGLVDVIVVYKIDRLSRSLMDFAKLVEAFDRNNVTFVSVTQAFNTTTSMGRLTLNILLSFAQFEREVTGERIRDKFAASRAKGMWMGGFVPMGYDVVDRKLVINEAEAATIRHMFQRFVELGSATLLTRELVAGGTLNKRGKLIDKGFLYKLFRNRLYLGEAVHKGTSYPGEHQAIITPELWDQVHAILQESPRQRAANTRTQTPALLKGLIFTDRGIAMTPTVTKKGSRHYRYYTSMDAIRNRACEGRDSFVRLNAGMVEAAVVQHIRSLLRTPEIAARAMEAARRNDPDIDEQDVVTALSGFDSLWESLFPAEQARIARLLIERVTVSADGLAVDLRTEGLGSVIREMVTPERRQAA